MSHLSRNLFYTLIIILGGCSQTTPQWDSETPYLPARSPQLGDILHTATGHYISRQTLFSSLGHYPLVYVGEVHDNPASHRLQLDILKAMLRQNPGKVALGMEMFNSGQQAALNKWSAGDLSEKEFLRESRWFDNWGSDFELYRELLVYSREQGIPIIGLNVPKSLGRKVSMTPIDQLDRETSEQLPEMDMDDPYQRMMVENIFGAHDAGSKMVESFFRRQTLWDEAMATSVADYMEQNPGKRMMVVAGGWHVNYGFGIPRRVHRRLALPYTLVGGYNLIIPDEKRDQLMDVEMPEFPMRAVDYLVYQEYEIFRPSGVKLGVMMDDGDDQAGIVIMDIVPDSAAAKAGINKGDRLLRIDNELLEDNFDLIYAVRNRRPGDSVTVELKRGVEVIELEIYFELDS